LREELGLETDILHPERVRQLWKFLREKVAEQYPHLVAATPQEDIDDMQTSVDHPVPMAPLVPVQSTPSSSSRTCASTQDSAGELPMEVLENDPPASTTTQEEFDILEPTYLENIQEEVGQELQDAMIISNHPRLQSGTAVAGSSSVSPKRKREQAQLQRSAGSEGKASPKKQANKAAFKSKTFEPAVRALTASHVPAMMTTGSIDHIGRDKQPRKRAKKGPNSKSHEVESTRDDRGTDSESNNALTAEDVSPSEQLLRALRLMKRANKSERTVRDTIGLDPDDFNKRIVHHRENSPTPRGSTSRRITSQTQYARIGAKPGCIRPKSTHTGYRTQQSAKFLSIAEVGQSALGGRSTRVAGNGFEKMERRSLPHYCSTSLTATPTSIWAATQ
jgi:hypothetical protein